MLRDVNPTAYAGMSYETASRRAQEVCRIAAQTGQTILAGKHLAALSAVMERRG